MRNTLVLTIAFFFTACYYLQPKDYLGQKLDTTHLQPLTSGSGEQHYQTTAFKTSFNYNIDSKRAEISLDGSLRCVLDPGTHWLGAILNRLSLDRVTINLLFADAAGTIAAVQQIRLAPDSFVFAPVMFKRTLPFQSSYKWVTVRVTAEMNDYEAEVTSYQIDETKSKEVGHFSDIED
jgi:hypothetical protein